MATIVKEAAIGDNNNRCHTHEWDSFFHFCKINYFLWQCNTNE